MTANEMIFNAAILSIALTLFGVAWGFLMLKIQGGEQESL
ncbi:MAG: cytochrome B6 [Cyanobacteria bacterium QH_8_48_120]|jgi:cytochrome b6-f complex subunit 7|nr:MAG: cytochrome B6 [Cyanobacteria bacterium QH_1_48_107]PSO56131.1 MAG: cytochrome B6 [Cyanobacteria bacterium QH_10_48_56]PSO61167.1 MAG: cytochrome B6 [Cyanobacteria bacterium QH_7_48_89]PSO66205.1 MAG: cytochrome B6 [Cyanobacteria bacterium QH_6_48_35]PSO66384.1 MAG: cytochrome B6 [Cyanobacteria bacterium QH_2_48_84]PSO68547.1 MAG: cytochrome B6 [Cyanobacteria bacterium QS_1_48_34]PSO71496.1 MAG: cytochrome B6 [Cyanobacteria bacterium QH_3_48_40]PSO77716.1 MAG: cytochrome B6 [Cyanobact